MKKEEFVAVIKKLVKEEVRSQVKHAVTEEMNTQMSRLLAEVIRGGHQSAMTAPAPTQYRGQPMPINEHVMSPPAPPPVQAGKRHAFTKTGNPALDQLLSQTVADLPQDSAQFMGESEEMGEIRRIGDTENINFAEMFQPKAAEIVIDRSSNMNMLKSIVGAGDGMHTISALDVPDQINPIAGALKKDYRSMMKDMDGIKSRMRSGPMAMPQIDPDEWRRLDAEEAK